MARSILKSKRLPNELLVEVVVYATYLSNKSPTRNVWGKTPQEAWSGGKLSISHLRVFRSTNHLDIPNKRKTKLDDKSQDVYFHQL